MTNRDNILQKATALFMKKGCKAVTMDEVATENGISKRTLYEQFSDKENLLEACILFEFRKNYETFHTLDRETSNVIELFIRIQEKQSDPMLPINDEFIEGVIRHYPNIYRRTLLVLWKRHLDVVTGLLERGKEQGMILPHIPSELVSRILGRIMQFTKASELYSNYEVSRVKLFELAVIAYIRGISTETGRRIIDRHYGYSVIPDLPQAKQ